jgi:hypothetical protein
MAGLVAIERRAWMMPPRSLGPRNPLAWCVSSSWRVVGGLVGFAWFARGVLALLAAGGFGGVGVALLAAARFLAAASLLASLSASVCATGGLPRSVVAWRVRDSLPSRARAVWSVLGRGWAVSTPDPLPTLPFPPWRDGAGGDRSGTQERFLQVSQVFFRDWRRFNGNPRDMGLTCPVGVCIVPSPDALQPARAARGPG